MWPVEKVTWFQFPYYIQHSNVKLKCEYSDWIQQTASSQEDILDVNGSFQLGTFSLAGYFLAMPGCFSHHISVGFGRRFPFAPRETCFVLIDLICEFGVPRISLCKQTESNTSRINGAVVAGNVNLTSAFCFICSRTQNTRACRQGRDAVQGRERGQCGKL